MKKLFPKILIFTLAVLLVFSLVACNKQRNQQEEEHNEYETTLYTVTFSTNGGLSDFSQFNLTDVASGTFISAPKYSDGSAAIPTKVGYDFAYWSANGAEEFDFATTPVTSNLTLTAIYTSKQYKHTPNISAELKQNDDGSYSIVNGAYTYGHFDTPEENEFCSYYNSSSGTFKVPTTTLAGDWFVFWYYLNDSGKPVRFTTMASETSTTQSLSQLTSYTFTKPLTLYAMWHSQLPKLNVVFKDSLSDTVYKQLDLAMTDYLDETEAPNMSEAKAGYAFEKWYFVTTDSDGNEVLKDFTFDIADESDDNPTLPSDAAGVTSEFSGGTLTLYASWKKLVTVTNKTEFDNLYNDLRGDDEDRINTILGATIKIAGTIDLGTSEYEPLFDAEHRFEGIIDGGKPDANGNIVENSKIVGGVFGASSNASVFGNIAGELKNLDFENVGLKFSVQDNATFVAGVVASVSASKIHNVNVTIASLQIGVDGATIEDGYLKNGLSSVTFGGVVGKNAGGEITDTTVTLSSVNILAESIVFGGVAGESTSKISEVDVNVNVASIKAVDNNKSADGLSFAKIGGVAGSNGGSISKIDVTIALAEVESKNGFDFGGVCASNLGSITLSKAVATLASSAQKALVGGTVNAGGLVGKNTGTIANTHSAADLYVNYDSNSASVNLGGLVGNANAGTLYTSYSTGSINLSTARASKAYAGGLVGVDASCTVAYSFAVVDVVVQNAGNENYLGSVAGSDANGKVKSAWYASGCTLTVNGEALGDRGVGISTILVNLKSDVFVIGTSSTIRFDSTVWEIVGDNLPTLK
ncbi:MAG: InlB B-repeat-containing protein [Clostridia bacterium]|nr:InlB B-repeat-containing protein [Clostridia bacterium]